LVLRSKKVFILSLFFSFICHTAVLSVTTYIELNGKSPKSFKGNTVKVINVDLQQVPMPQKKAHNQEIKKTELLPKQQKEVKTLASQSFPEDTVDLNAPDSNYTPYLEKIKRKIDYTWLYPRQSYAAGEEGVTVIKFSINQSGALVAGNITTSSGSRILDQGVLEAVQSAAPYDPLPDHMKISKLHIVATFNYKLSK
jgi:TonB family protein